MLTDFSLAKVVEPKTAQPAATKAGAGAGKKRKHDKGAADKGGAAVRSGPHPNPNPDPNPSPNPNPDPDPDPDLKPDPNPKQVHTSAMGIPTYTAPEIVSGGSDYGTQALLPSYHP